MGRGHSRFEFLLPRDLGAILARTRQCQECMVKQYFRYVTGRVETPADTPLIQKSGGGFPQIEFPFSRTDHLSDPQPRGFTGRKEYVCHR